MKLISERQRQRHRKRERNRETETERVRMIELTGTVLGCLPHIQIQASLKKEIN